MNISTWISVCVCACEKNVCLEKVNRRLLLYYFAVEMLLLSRRKGENRARAFSPVVLKWDTHTHTLSLHTCVCKVCTYKCEKRTEAGKKKFFDIKKNKKLRALWRAAAPHEDVVVVAVVTAGEWRKNTNAGATSVNANTFLVDISGARAYLFICSCVCVCGISNHKCMYVCVCCGAMECRRLCGHLSILWQLLDSRIKAWMTEANAENKRKKNTKSKSCRSGCQMCEWKIWEIVIQKKIIQQQFNGYASTYENKNVYTHILFHINYEYLTKALIWFYE